MVEDGDDKTAGRTTTMQQLVRERVQHDPTRTGARSRCSQKLENIASIFFLSLYYNQDKIKPERVKNVESFGTHVIAISKATSGVVNLPEILCGSASTAVTLRVCRIVPYKACHERGAPFFFFLGLVA